MTMTADQIAWRQRRANEIVRRLKAFYKKHGRSPTQREMAYAAHRDRSLPSYGTIAEYLGSIRDAFAAAGIPYRAKGDCLRRTKTRDRGRTVVAAPRASAPRPCERCEKAFIPDTRRGKLCMTCKPSPKPQPMPTRKQPIHRTDFLLALPEMRRELQRQCQEAGTMRQDYMGGDPLSIPAGPRRRSA
jgi:hypothetical protein